MKTWDVVVRAVVTKTIRVEAESEDGAVEQAHMEFTSTPDDEECYKEETLSVKEVGNEQVR